MMTASANTGRGRRLLAGLALGLIVPAAAAAPSDPFPAGERLRPRVEFWKRIYSRVSSDQAVLHDAEDLGIVYQVVNLEGRREWRDIERFIQPIRDRYADTLRALAGGPPALPESEAAAILARFGPGADPEQLRRAAENVRFQRGQADAFLEGLVRSGAYESHLRRIFRQAGVPSDLTYLPHVESSFRPHAYSRSGAAGIWQFTRSTGRHYLRISSLIDERWDPIEASQAAARLLRHNFQQLGTWPLAITAYNHGLEGMKRAVARLGTRNLEEIIERYQGRSFGFASKNFYAEFLAAREVASDPERYFGSIPRWPELRYQELRLDREASASDLDRALGLSICDLAHYNPALRPGILSGETPLPAGYRLKIPAGITLPGTSVAALLEALRRPALRSAAPLAPHTPPRPSRSRRQAAAPLPSPWIASLSGPPGPGPGSGGASFLLDGSLLWHLPEGIGPRPWRGPVPGPAERAAAPGPSPAPLPAGVSRPVRIAGGPNLSPWRWLGTSLQGPLGLHPDWAPWMRPGSVAVPPSLGLAALRISDGRIQVEPEENLALLAFWLDIRASRLRQLNDLRAGEALRPGQWLRADFSRVSEEQFVARRLRFQRDLAAQFLREHRVTDTRIHRVRPGETLWSIARRYGRLPLWVLRWYNDGPQWPEPAPGSEVVVPVVERYSS